MTTSTRGMIAGIALGLILSSSSTLVAQTVVTPPIGEMGLSVGQDVLFYKQATPVPGAPTGATGGGVVDHTVTFISAVDSGGEATVKGAPYSGEAVTESIQVLSDGNRIVRKVASQIARDSEGRTRRDQTLEALGPWVPAGPGSQVSFIMDPVKNVQYILEHETRTAREVPLMGRPGAAGVIRSRVMAATAVQPFEFPLPEGGMPAVAGTFIGPMVKRMDAKYESRTESLGTRSIDGVEAEGTRVVTTIPAGAIGNERPIEMVSETWYAPSLQLLILSRNTDPRFGETTYRIDNLSLLEPVPSLFEIPSDYTMTAGPARLAPPPPR